MRSDEWPDSWNTFLLPSARALLFGDDDGGAGSSSRGRRRARRRFPPPRAPDLRDDAGGPPLPEETVGGLPFALPSSRTLGTVRSDKWLDSWKLRRASAYRREFAGRELDMDEHRVLWDCKSSEAVAASAPLGRSGGLDGAPRRTG